ncbi:hypothetical protein QQS21_006491 [Conoideocrella luteorostrata]|uniref:LSM complex subunit LSM4 n=1 Tax=Conoideocrella luteorostrata TaxID=1105319 RepID=A0AAJ0CNB2_9HYPO|nr:hypothetical protein QQS21_006491 [Conoideocrella luteorostrata]
MLPLSLLNAAQGHPMLVELKNGETLNGHLVQCDTWMNLTLREVVQTSPGGDKSNTSASTTTLSTKSASPRKTNKEILEVDVAVMDTLTVNQEEIMAMAAVEAVIEVGAGEVVVVADEEEAVGNEETRIERVTE